jgi:hypothetical protein
MQSGLTQGSIVNDAGAYDIFFSYAHGDNDDEWIDSFSVSLRRDACIRGRSSEGAILDVLAVISS